MALFGLEQMVNASSLNTDGCFALLARICRGMSDGERRAVAMMFGVAPR